MVIADPAAELLDLVRALGDAAPCEAGRDQLGRAMLVRRRFGLSLPPPFVHVDADANVRPAEIADAAAVAAIKWRSFGVDYRGVLADDFLDGRDVVPPVGYWRDLVARPDDPNHRLFVWGGRGIVQGYVEIGAERDANTSAPTDPEVGEILEIYVDPCAQGRGGGARLLEHAVDRLRSDGFDRLELSTAESNERSHRFYRSHGWEPLGAPYPVDLGIVSFEERRFGRSLTPGSTR